MAQRLGTSNLSDFQIKVLLLYIIQIQNPYQETSNEYNKNDKLCISTI